MTPETGVTLASLPVLLPLFIAHLKSFARALHDYLRGWSAGPDSPWPLVTDLVAVVAVAALWSDHQLPPEIVHWPSMVLLGISVGLGIGPLYNVATSVLNTPPTAPPGTANPLPAPVPPPAPGAPSASGVPAGAPSGIAGP